ncbi:MAG TPA: TCR/Tet family MFS transporter [Xanthobacteraceae bacterium]|nr:TCR/Tet family MFS transporter [Xanthobacteraceae bacterium]
MPTLRPFRQAAFAFIFVTVLLDMLALGMVIPVLPKLVESFVAGDTARASEYVGLFGAVWALMQFLFSPIQGATSDRFGRRPVILVSNFGLGLDYVVMALAPNLGWLFGGRVVSGICSASVSTAFAYIADVTPAEQRAARFGMIGAAFGVGFVVGPALGGVLGALDPRLPFWAAAGASLLNGLYGLLVVPESLPPERRTPFSWRRANPLGSLMLLRAHRELYGLAGANFLAQLAHVALPVVFVLYADYRYGWGERAIGFTLALVGVCAIGVQAGLVGRAVKRFGERGALAIGLLFGALGFAVYGVAPSGWLFVVGVPLMALWGLASPAANGLMSKRVSPSEQGQLQGANASIQGIANLVAPVIFAQLFAYAIGAGRGWNLPGAPFLVAAVLLVAAAALAWRVTRPVTTPPAADT